MVTGTVTMPRYAIPRTALCEGGAWLERRNTCGYCGRRGIYDTAPDGTLHCYRDGCVARAEGRPWPGTPRSRCASAPP